jgi:hypothetical protein
MVVWTTEKIAALPQKELESLFVNALKRDAEVARLCAAEMASRKPPDKPREKRGQSTSHEVDEVVAGFHFVCPEEKSVVREIDGLMWSGTWVVAGVHAERALKIDAYIALHRSKAELSYLQGRIVNFRKAQRERSYSEGQDVQTEFGIDFQFEPTDKQYKWVGDGSGEKGYYWRKRGVGEP